MEEVVLFYLLHVFVSHWDMLNVLNDVFNGLIFFYILYTFNYFSNIFTSMLWIAATLLNYQMAVLRVNRMKSVK